MDETVDVPVKDLAGKKVSYDILRYIPEESAVYYKFAPVGLTEFRIQQLSEEQSVLTTCLFQE